MKDLNFEVDDGFLQIFVTAALIKQYAYVLVTGNMIHFQYKNVH